MPEVVARDITQPVRLITERQPRAGGQAGAAGARRLSDQNPPAQSRKRRDRIPLQNTVISSGAHYPLEPIIITGSINAKS
jgi:hypothetical protein